MLGKDGSVCFISLVCFGW